MRDAGFEVIHKAGDRTGEFALIVAHQALGQITGDRPAGCLVGRGGPRLEVRPARFAPCFAASGTLAARFLIR